MAHWRSLWADFQNTVLKYTKEGQACGAEIKGLLAIPMCPIRVAGF